MKLAISTVSEGGGACVASNDATKVLEVTDCMQIAPIQLPRARESC